MIGLQITKLNIIIIVTVIANKVFHIGKKEQVETHMCNCAGLLAG